MMASTGCSSSGVTPIWRTWVDRDTGMWCLRGEFDPETGALFEARLRTTVETLFRDKQPDTCPTDALSKQHHLRALALVALTAGTGKRASGRIDMSILIDAETLLQGSIRKQSSTVDCRSICRWRRCGAGRVPLTSPRSSSAPMVSRSTSDELRG